MHINSQDLILKTIQEKARLKLKVVQCTSLGFSLLKNILSLFQNEIKSSVNQSSAENNIVNFIDKGDFEAEFTLVDDTIVFLMHSNVFTFENNHEIWKSSYVQEDPSRTFCGKIDVYNFLSDSFKYNRANDIGYLIARIFINRESHFFVEGKRQLGFLYTDFANSEFDANSIRKVIESAILYSLDFEPYTPPYEQMSQITVQEVLNATMQSKIVTGKRLGFRFLKNGEDPF